MLRVLETARALVEDRIYLFFLEGGHYLNPLVPDERQRLESGAAPLEPGLNATLEELTRPPRPPAGIYFPIPIARAIGQGHPSREAFRRHHYTPIRVDPDQRWWWEGGEVAPRTRRFFAEHLAYEPSLGLYFFEYRVHDGWWDKRYLEVEVTPLLATQLRISRGPIEVLLNTGRWETLHEPTLRLDARERLLADAGPRGEVLLSEALRFRLLRGMSDDLTCIQIGEHSVPVSWPQELPGPRT